MRSISQRFFRQFSCTLTYHENCFVKIESGKISPVILSICHSNSLKLQLFLPLLFHLYHAWDVSEYFNLFWCRDHAPKYNGRFFKSPRKVFFASLATTFLYITLEVWSTWTFVHSNSHSISLNIKKHWT